MLCTIQAENDAEPLLESESDDCINDADMDGADPISNLRSGERTADPASIVCGSLPDGCELDDIVYPLTLRKSRAAESKYVVEFVNEDKNLLPPALPHKPQLTPLSRCDSPQESHGTS